MEREKLKALITLLDDTDENIFHQVREAILKEGYDAIPLLEESWENTELGPEFRSRLEEIVHSIQYENVRSSLTEWINSTEKDLLEGAVIVAKYHYPSIEYAGIEAQIESIKKQIWLEINEYQTAYEKIRIFNKVFFGKIGFRGAGSDYYSPFNSYINLVLESKKGNPISIAIIYSIVAQRLDMPVYGVNLPNHFIAAFLDTDGILKHFSEEEHHGVLFYINPYSKGTIFDKQEIDSYLENLNRDKELEYYEPCSNTTIINRMITNLIIAYEQEGKTDKADELRELRQLFDLKI